MKDYRVIELDNPVMCPPCRTYWQRQVIEDDSGQDRIGCGTCKRLYWRRGASCRFADTREGEYSFAVLVPELTQAAEV
jgi:hypothetical protein